MGIINTLFAATFALLGFSGYMFIAGMPDETGVVTAINIKELDGDSVQCEIEYATKGSAKVVAISPLDFCNEYAVGQEIPLKDGRIVQFEYEDF